MRWYFTTQCSDNPRRLSLITEHNLMTFPQCLLFSWGLPL
jgi:hypothetical protein